MLRLGELASDLNLSYLFRSSHSCPANHLNDRKPMRAERERERFGLRSFSMITATVRQRGSQRGTFVPPQLDSQLNNGQFENMSEA